MKTQTPQRRGIAWVLAGFSLQVLGAVLIWRTLPDFGPDVIGGVAAVVCGSLLITWGVVQRAKRDTQAPPPPTAGQGGWLPEPELRRVTPRVVRLSRSGRRMVAWWAILLMAIPLYTWFVIQRAGGPRVDHSDDYVEGTATIHDKAVRDSVGSKRFYIYYHFQVDALPEVRASTTVSESDYNKYNVGDPLRVLYLSPNPTVHEVLDLREKGAAPPVIWFAAGVATLLLIVFEMIRRRHKTITALGAPAAGKIDMVHRRGAGYVYTVRCDAGGIESSIRATEREPAVREGDSITVLYLPHKPDQRLIYRLSMYEAV